MKINTSRHKNEDNLSQDDLEANSRLVSSALSKLLQAYDGVYKVNWKGMYEFCGATFIFEEGEDR